MPAVASATGSRSTTATVPTRLTRVGLRTRSILNGRLRLLRAHALHRRVAVDAGRHRIEMRYRPRLLPLAIAVAALIAVLLAAWAVAGRLRRPAWDKKMGNWLEDRTRAE